MIDQQYNIKLIDFGHMTSDEETDYGVGTLNYNAIDLITMFHCSSKALDLWQVNVMIHMILTK